MSNEQLETPLVWGVFGQDCYGLPEEIIKNLLLKTFEDYWKALNYATSLGEDTAIHLTRRRKNHEPKVLSMGNLLPRHI